MRRLLVILMLAVVLMGAPFAFAQHETATTATHAQEGDVAHGTEKEAHKEAHPTESHGGGEGHAPETYFGIPGWILKTLNMILFLGVLIYAVRGPVSKGMAARREAIKAAAEEAKERREKADRMAGDIQARLAAIEAEVRSIHERAAQEGERQKRELIIAADAEREKILNAARNEVDNRLKHARTELTEYAGELAAARAHQILAEKITEDDQKRLFQDSLKQVAEVRS